MAQEIQLTSDGSQSFSTTIEGVTYSFNVSYNTRLGLWTADISTNGDQIAGGIPLLGGVDILQQLTLDLDNLFVINLVDRGIDAGSDNLGSDVRLYHFSDSEIAIYG